MRAVVIKWQLEKIISTIWHVFNVLLVRHFVFVQFHLGRNNFSLPFLTICCNKLFQKRSRWNVCKSPETRLMMAADRFYFLAYKMAATVKMAERSLGWTIEIETNKTMWALQNGVVNYNNRNKPRNLNYEFQSKIIKSNIHLLAIVWKIQNGLMEMCLCAKKCCYKMFILKWCYCFWGKYYKL